MAKKSFKFSYDAPVTLTFVLLSALVFILDTYVFKGFLSENALVCLGSFEGHRFDASNALDYVRLFCHVFGNGSWLLFMANSAFMLLMGPALEERYGSPAVLIMFFVTIVVSGVLGQTISPYPMMGCSSLIFMMVLVSSLMAFSKREIKLSYILIFLLYTAYSLYTGYENNGMVKEVIQGDLEGAATTDSKNGFVNFLLANVPVFISLAAGLTGSLFGFLVAPKKSKADHKEEDFSYKAGKSKKKPSKSKKSKNKDETLKADYYGPVSDYVPDSASSSSSSNGNEETIIGSIEF